MRPELDYSRCEVPAGRSGDWVVEKFAVGEGGAVDRRPVGFRSPPGTYTRLRHGDAVFMTDLRPEWWSQRRAIEEAGRRGGDVLLTGLGLGLVVDALLAAPRGADAAGRDRPAAHDRPRRGRAPVESVTVVEVSSDVIALVGPHLRAKHGERVRIVEADAFEWLPPPGVRYTVGWHDIWPNPHDDTRWPEMEALERRFARYCDWQGSWVREHLAAEAS